jgi:NDP-sugar pyrophosphorylase family protein
MRNAESGKVNPHSALVTPHSALLTPHWNGGLLMKAVLICPAERRPVAALAEPAPLSNLLVLGKTVVQYWLEHLASKGAREVYLLAVDRPEQVLAHVGSGSRWGLEVIVFNELHELTPQEAITEYRHGDGWLSGADLVNTMDHLPGFRGHPLFESYAAFVSAQQALMPLLAGPDRVGLRQVEPGVWVGLRARVSKSARLHAPCWVGDEALVSRGAVIGPMAVIETRSVIEAGAEVTNSIVGPDTLVGEYASLSHSIAWGSTLINWQLNSYIQVADRFLISSLAKVRRTNECQASRLTSPVLPAQDLRRETRDSTRLSVARGALTQTQQENHPDGN